jgi:hypothetical protein
MALKKISEPDAPEESEIPEVGELNELGTFVVAKPNKVWIWTGVNHFRAGILAWVVGNDRTQTFEPSGQIVCCLHCYFSVVAS